MSVKFSMAVICQNNGEPEMFDIEMNDKEHLPSYNPWIFLDG